MKFEVCEHSLSFLHTHTVRAVALEIGTAGSASLISNIHWKSGHPVSLISNVGSPKNVLRRLRRRRNRVAENRKSGAVAVSVASVGYNTSTVKSLRRPTCAPTFIMAWRDKARAFAAGGSAVVGATELQRRGEARRPTRACRVPKCENFFARLRRAVSLISNNNKKFLKISVSQFPRPDF